MRRLLAVGFAATSFLVFAGTNAVAENAISVRGHYFREASTRVVQPVVQVSKDVPGGVDVTAHYLLDAITSASAAAGPSGDNVFTEYRNEFGAGMGWNWSRVRIGAAYRYSAESDYWSHTGVGSLALRLWGDTATLALSGGASADVVGRRVPPNVPTPPPTPGAACQPRGPYTCSLRLIFGGLGYTQVLSPAAVVQVSYEFADMNGFLASPYRQVAGMGFENVPRHRFRNALAARVGYYVRALRAGAQLHYRYYWDWERLNDVMDVVPGTSDPTDPWRVTSQTIEARVYKEIGRDVEVRLTGRYYPQGPANFWCDQQASPACYQGRSLFTGLFAGDPKLGKVTTTFLEAKVYWDAIALRGIPFFGWFADGTFELSYGHLWQSTAFGAAHLIQTGYLIRY